MPPFSAVDAAVPAFVPNGTSAPFSTNGRLPNSMKEFCPEKPCQPSATTHGGSMRPVDSNVLQLVTPVEGEVVQALGGSLLAGPPRMPVGCVEQSASAQ